jgi:twinkle protein
MDKALKGLVMKQDVDYLEQIAELESRPYLAYPANLLDDLKRHIKHQPTGLGLPFAGTSLLRFVPGRWSLWSGPAFSGKTAFLRFLMTHAIKEGERVFFASLEEEPVLVAKEFCTTVLTMRQLDERRVEDAIDWLDDRLVIFNHSGFIEPDVVIGAAIYAAKEFGITHAVIDSLMMLSIRKDDFDAQKELGMKLNRATRQYGIHFHLVVHPRKTTSSQDMMDMYDIQGAQELVALAHTVATIQRAPSSPKKREEWGIGGPGSLGDKCDSVLRAWKQRGDWNRVGMLELAYLPRGRQWALHPEHGHRRFMPDDMYSALQIKFEKRNPYDDRLYGVEGEQIGF